LQAYTANLHHLGIQVVLRQMDIAQYTSRVEKFDFDVIIGLIPQSISPGNEQRDMWQSAQADRIGSKNYGGIKNPVIDDLVDKLIATQTREELIAHTQALDRVLLWNYYSIPLYTKKSMDIAYRKTIGMPAIVPSYTLDMDAWWHQENQLSK
jgi:microcin C transport system substrate-binding protein